MSFEDSRSTQVLHFTLCMKTAHLSEATELVKTLKAKFGVVVYYTLVPFTLMHTPALLHKGQTNALFFLIPQVWDTLLL